VGRIACSRFETPYLYRANGFQSGGPYREGEKGKKVEGEKVSTIGPKVSIQF